MASLNKDVDLYLCLEYHAYILQEVTIS